jgi:putative transposase
VKYAWISQHDKQFELNALCRVLDVSLSGYRAWKRGGSPERKRLTDTQMLALIRSIHVEFRGAYGSPRMVRELRARGFGACKARVERLMHDHGIRARHKRRCVTGSLPTPGTACSGAEPTQTGLRPCRAESGMDLGH